MNTIVTETRQLGVVPVLITIPPRADLAAAEQLTESLNASLWNISINRHVPLINLWRALQPLPDRGTCKDGVHPSTENSELSADFSPAGLDYGYDRFNFVVVRTLRRLLAAALRANVPV
jgi:hypothetical protein